MPHIPRNIQGPYVAADFWTQWGSVNPRMALFVLITPTAAFGGSSAAVGLTSNTRDMTLPGHPGVTFRSTPGITPTAVEQALDVASNLEMTGIYQTGIFQHIDVMAGKWAFASIEVFTACWNNTDLGELVDFKGNMGEFKDYQTYFTAEGRGLISRLSNDVNAVTSRFCRVKEFRDAQCGHVAATVTINSNVYDIVNAGLPAASIVDVDGEFVEFDSADLPFSPANAETDRVFLNGKITCTTGPNAGVSREIASVLAIFPGLRVYLKRSFPYSVAIGNEFTLTAGCNRTIENCMKFSNIVNRRAEDWIPGVEVSNRVNAR